MSIQLMRHAAKAMLVDAVDDTSGHEGSFDSAKVLVYNNNLTPTDVTAYGDLTPATTVATNPSTAVTWGTPYYDQNGNARVVGSAVVYTCSDPGEGETIYGYAVFTGTNPDQVLLWAENFDTPVQIAQAGDGFTVVVSLEQSTGEVYGSGTLIS